MVKSLLIRSVSILLVYGLGSCASTDPGQLKTVTGRELGKMEWKTITDQESVIHISDPPRISRIRSDDGIFNRYRELVNFANGGYILYSHLFNGIDTSDGNKEMLYQFMQKANLLKRHGVTIERDDIEEVTISGTNYSYSAKSSNSVHCFVFHAYFGEFKLNSDGDQSVRGLNCRNRNTITQEKLKAEWLGLLERIRFDGPKPGWASKAISDSPIFSDLMISDKRIDKGIDTKGRTIWRPGNFKNSFVIEQDTIAFFHTRISNIEIGSTHSWYWKFYTPDNRIHWNSKRFIRTFKFPVWNVYKVMRLYKASELKVGEWRVEFEFDDKIIHKRTFLINIQ